MRGGGTSEKNSRLAIARHDSIPYTRDLIFTLTDPHH